MNNALIGYNGFVGSNLLKQFNFKNLYNSQNIESIKNKKFDYVYCAAAPGEKWKANKNPDKDLEAINKLIFNLNTVHCKKIILISTIDVYSNPNNVNETQEIILNDLMPYGKNRAILENFIMQNFEDFLIIRLPGLFGNGLKKNIIYDLMHNNYLDMINFESIFQFYNLDRLSKDINICFKNQIKIINFATEPTSVREIVDFAFSSDIIQESSTKPVSYDVNTNYSFLFNNNSNSYIINKKDVLSGIKKFVLNKNKIK